MNEENKEVVVEAEEVVEEIAADITEDVSEIVTEEVSSALIEEAPAKKKHGKLGVISFILAFVSGLIVIIGLVISTRATLSLGDPNAIAMNPELINPDVLAPLMMAGMVMIFGAGLSFIGLILGIIGLFMKNTKKVFAIIGSILNGIPMILMVILIIAGLAMAGAM